MKPGKKSSMADVSRVGMPIHQLGRTRCSATWFHGLPSRPGGTVFYQPVHKMFGCVYWVDMDADMGIMKPEDKS